MKLLAEILKVSASALNVRSSGDPRGDIVDVLRLDASFQVEEIDEWGSMGSYWACITYN